MKPEEKLAETIYQTSMWLISKGLYHNYRCDEFDTVQFLISKYIYDKTGGNFNGKQYDF